MDITNPDYYKRYSIEVFDMLLKIYGNDTMVTYCEITALNYRLRAGSKDKDFESDIKKALWYEAKIKELKGNNPTKLKIGHITVKEIINTDCTTTIEKIYHVMAGNRIIAELRSYNNPKRVTFHLFFPKRIDFISQSEFKNIDTAFEYVQDQWEDFTKDCSKNFIKYGCK